MRETKQLHRAAKPAFAIIGDGECEEWYFQMLKRNERSLNVQIKPELPKRKKLKEQFDLVLALSKDYNKVFWIVDLDVIIKNSKETAKGKKSEIKQLDEYFEKIKKKHKNIVVIINNPCLEFWILLHFEQTGKYFVNCDSVTNHFKHKKHLPDYEKTKKYYTKEDNDIYLRLKPFVVTAIKNAKCLSEFDKNNSETALCQMHLFFETIGIS